MVGIGWGWEVALLLKNGMICCSINGEGTERETCFSKVQIEGVWPEARLPGLQKADKQQSDRCRKELQYSSEGIVQEMSLSWLFKFY